MDSQSKIEASKIALSIFFNCFPPKMSASFVVIFFLSFTGTALLLYLAPAFVTAYVVVLLIILVILVFKQIKIMISVKITSKDNLLYNICKPYSLIQHYKNKSSYESIEIDEVIEHFKSFLLYCKPIVRIVFILAFIKKT